MRKYYIDNIRILCILMLFPFHTAMIFNGLGERWYVHSKDLYGATLLNIAVLSMVDVILICIGWNFYCICIKE